MLSLAPGAHDRDRERSGDVSRSPAAPAGKSVDASPLPAAAAGTSVDASSLRTATAGTPVDASSLPAATAGKSVDAPPLPAATASTSVDASPLPTAVPGTSVDASALPAAARPTPVDASPSHCAARRQPVRPPPTKSARSSIALQTTGRDGARWRGVEARARPPQSPIAHAPAGECGTRLPCAESQRGEECPPTEPSPAPSGGAPGGLDSLRPSRSGRDPSAARSHRSRGRARARPR